MAAEWDEPGTKGGIVKHACSPKQTAHFLYAHVSHNNCPHRYLWGNGGASCFGQTDSLCMFTIKWEHVAWKEFDGTLIFEFNNDKRKEYCKKGIWWNINLWV